MRSLAVLMVMAAARVASADTDAPVIEHTPVAEATLGESVTVSVRIVDESEIFLPAIHLRAAGAGKWEAQDLTAKDGKFVAEIEVKGDVEYWIEAYDEFGNGPAVSGSSKRPHRIRANAPPRNIAEAPDTEPPTLVHTPLRSAPAGKELTISARITDRSGVFAPMIYIRPDGADIADPRDLTAEGDTYSATVEVESAFDYWIEAYDNLGNGPVRSGEATAPHRVQLAEPEPEPEPVTVVQVTEPEPLPEAVIKPQEKPSGPSIFERVPRKWWIGGGAGVVGTTLVGFAVYSLATQPDYDRFVVLQSARR